MTVIAPATMEARARLSPEGAFITDTPGSAAMEAGPATNMAIKAPGKASAVKNPGG